MAKNTDPRLIKPMFVKEDYYNAIDFALNYPRAFKLVEYDSDKDIYIVLVLDGGWYTVNLLGKFVRSCLKWKGIKKWKRDTHSKSTI